MRQKPFTIRMGYVDPLQNYEHAGPAKQNEIIGENIGEKQVKKAYLSMQRFLGSALGSAEQTFDFPRLQEIFNCRASVNTINEMMEAVQGIQPVIDSSGKITSYTLQNREQAMRSLLSLTEAKPKAESGAFQGKEKEKTAIEGNMAKIMGVIDGNFPDSRFTVGELAEKLDGFSLVQLGKLLDMLKNKGEIFVVAREYSHGKNGNFTKFYQRSKRTDQLK